MTVNEKPIPEFNYEHRNEGQYPFDDYPPDSFESVLDRFLSRVYQIRPVKHCSGEDEKEINGEIPAFENGHDIVKMPKDNDPDQCEPEKLNRGIFRYSRVRSLLQKISGEEFDSFFQ